MSERYERLARAEAWDQLVDAYEDFGAEDADDHVLAELLRRMIAEVEG